jgi:hypothetical protein
VNLIDFDHPFFRPLWIRILTVGIAAAWGTFELLTGAPFWGVLFLGLAALAAHGLFIRFKPRWVERDEKGME